MSPRSLGGGDFAASSVATFLDLVLVTLQTQCRDRSWCGPESRRGTNLIKVLLIGTFEFDANSFDTHLFRIHNPSMHS